MNKYQIQDLRDELFSKAKSNDAWHILIENIPEEHLEDILNELNEYAEEINGDY